MTMTGLDRIKVLRETDTITAFAGEQLKALQAESGIAQKYSVTTAPIVLPQTPVSQSKAKFQYVAGTIIAGLTSAFFLCFFVDAIALARRRKQFGAPINPWPMKKPARGFLGRPLDATAVLTGYIALALFIPSDQALPALGGVGTPANVFALLGLIWYVASWIRGRILPAPGTRSPRLAMCVLAAAVLMAYIADASRNSSHQEVLGADRGLIGFLVWVSLVVLASAGIQDRTRLDVLMRRLIIMASIVAALGYYDFFSATNIADSIQIPGLHSSVAGITAMGRGSFTRPRSTTAQPLEFGGMLAILLPFAIQQALDPVRKHLHWLRRWGPVMLMGGALPLTVSRTSIIGAVIVAMVVIPRWKPVRRWTAIAMLLGSVAVFKVMIPGLIGTITTLFSTMLSNSDSSTQARTVKYAEIVPYVVERPWFGRGFGTFTPDLYFFTDNQYMLILADMGLLGVFALLVLCATGIHHGGAIRRVARNDSDRELGQAFFASSMVALVISATFDSLSFAMFAGMFFLLLGLGGSYLGFIRRDARLAVLPALPKPIRREPAPEPQLVES
jgi:O-antigen ligase